MLLHVTRDPRGQRRLSEIAVLRQADGGRVQAVTAWHVDRGPAEVPDLRELLRTRLPA